MEDEIISIRFSAEEYFWIEDYQRSIAAPTIQSAILNAISLAIDHLDD